VRLSDPGINVNSVTPLARKERFEPGVSACRQEIFKTLVGAAWHRPPDGNRRFVTTEAAERGERRHTIVK